MTSTSTAAPAAPTTTVPATSSTAVVPWGDWAEQALINETTLLESLASGGVSLALSEIPFGSFVANFIGPTVVKGLVDTALKALEGVLSTATLAIPASNTILTTVANMLNANYPALANFLGSNLEPMIQAEIAKVFPAAAKA